MERLKTNRRLVIAIALFVVFDLSALAFNSWITLQIGQDAVAINLAGRQRMLSQRVTKAILMAGDESRSVDLRRSSLREAQQAYALFLQTLHAFALGGMTDGGDGRPVYLAAVSGHAALLVGNTRGQISVWREVPTDPVGINRFCKFMVENNEAILHTMNELTTDLERQSVAFVGQLRAAQALVFALSLLNFLAVLLEMSRSRRTAEAAALRDTLTGLLNRAGIYRTLSQAVETCQHSGRPLGVLLLDLDHFKAVNDAFGHAAGDATLKEASRRLSAWCQQDWTCGRLGGDEFVVICPDIPADQLPQYADDLGKVLSGIPGGNSALVSASVGFAACTEGCTADALIAAADTSMYAEKSRRGSRQNYRAVSR